MPRARGPGRCGINHGLERVNWYAIELLVVLEDPLNGPRNQHHIDPFLAFQHANEFAVFQDDKAAPHCYNVAREWIEEHAGKVQRLSCLPEL